MVEKVDSNFQRRLKRRYCALDVFLANRRRIPSTG
jgi:hypothetical protein